MDENINMSTKVEYINDNLTWNYFKWVCPIFKKQKKNQKKKKESIIQVSVAMIYGHNPEMEYLYLKIKIK